MPDRIASVAVLGAGAMGADIAAHVANAGLPVLLFDVTAARAREGLDRARRARPERFFLPELAERVEPLGFDDLARLAPCDWIIEAIIEVLDVKRTLLERVDAHRAPGAIVSSNTSGLSIAAMAEGRSAGFRRHWLGTHFFNPPRYLPLVEVIATADTDPAVVARVTAFLDHRLGKGVVLARDTPAFIANRLGIFGVMRLIELVAAGRYSIEEIDVVTGPLLGRPKSATFRTVDLAGLDILAHVASDLATRLPDADERRQFEAPPLVHEMLEARLLGDKTGGGFYKKTEIGGVSKILTLDLATAGNDLGGLFANNVNRPPRSFPYRERIEPTLPGLDEARAIGDTAARVRALFGRRDRTGNLVRDALVPTLLYAAHIAPLVAQNDIDQIDRAMRWGFGWELGPFEIWDAIGVREVLAAAGRDANAESDPLLADVIRTGADRFRTKAAPPAAPGLLILHEAKTRGRVLRQNNSATLVDLGDDVLCVEFHSKMNTIGGETIEMLHAGVDQAAANFAALIVGNEAANFSAGANLTLLLLESQDENWDEVDAMVRAFQRATMALKTSPVPVVAAPAGLTLGGGCEICLHSDRVQAAAETYMGLVEVGVGLIPAGGGTKEMLLRAGTAAAQSVFETLGFGKVSTSAPDARRLGYTRAIDGMTMNRERLIADAKARALSRVRDGYVPPSPRSDIPVGGPDAYATLALGVHLAWRAGRISDHDALIGRKLAWILTGGDVAHATTVSEQHLLDLERAAFLSLCGEQKTLQRIAYTLKTGKTLRN